MPSTKPGISWAISRSTFYALVNRGENHPESTSVATEATATVEIRRAAFYPAVRRRRGKTGGRSARDRVI